MQNFFFSFSFSPDREPNIRQIGIWSDLGGIAVKTMTDASIYLRSEILESQIFSPLHLKRSLIDAKLSGRDQLVLQ